MTEGTVVFVTVQRSGTFLLLLLMEGWTFTKEMSGCDFTSLSLTLKEKEGIETNIQWSRLRGSNKGLNRFPQKPQRFRSGLMLSTFS